jgi:hypothetical protein
VILECVEIAEKERNEVGHLLIHIYNIYRIDCKKRRRRRRRRKKKEELVVFEWI